MVKENTSKRKGVCDFWFMFLRGGLKSENIVLFGARELPQENHGGAKITRFKQPAAFIKCAWCHSVIMNIFLYTGNKRKFVQKCLWHGMVAALRGLESLSTSEL